MATLFLELTWYFLLSHCLVLLISYSGSSLYTWPAEVVQTSIYGSHPSVYIYYIYYFIQSYASKCHFNHNDSKMYFLTPDLFPKSTLVYNCLLNTCTWISNEHLNLNMSKSQFLVFLPNLLTFNLPHLNWWQIHPSNFSGQHHYGHPWVLSFFHIPCSIWANLLGTSFRIYPEFN